MKKKAKLGELKAAKLWFEKIAFAKHTLEDLENYIENSEIYKLPSTSTKNILTDLHRIIKKALNEEFSSVEIEEGF